MSIAAEAIDDLVKSTLESLPDPNFGMIAQDLPQYVVMNQLLRKDAIKFNSTENMTHKLMVDQSRTAEHVGLYADDDLSVQDNLQNVVVPMRHTTNNFIYDVTERAMNEGPEQIVDLIGTRRVDMMLGLAEKLEQSFWKAPSSSSDVITPWGIKYWLKPATSSRGFNGGDITGFSSGPGGLSSNTYTKWKHYNAVYDAFTDTDLAAELRRAYRACRFISPVKTLSNDGAQGSRYKLFCGEEVVEGLITMARAQNDSIGRDLAAYDGTVTFKRLPFQYVPQIDIEWSSTSYPIFMLDTKHLKVMVHSKNNFRETGPDPVSGKHNVRAVFTDLTWNIMCTDRRRQAWINRV